MPSRPVRVLVPYITTYYGGVRRVLEAGLPLLARVGGLEVAYAELCRNDRDMDAMAAAGVAVDRALGVPGPSAFSRGPGLRRIAGAMAGAPRLARMAWRLADAGRDHDVLYVHGVRELTLALAARRLARAAPPAIVWHWHGPPLSLGRPPSRREARLVRALSRSCARVVAISAFCARQVVGMGVDPHRVATVLNAAAVDEAGARVPAAPLPPRGPGEFTLLVACASLRPHKGVHVAVEALARLPANHVLWVTGDASDPVARPYVAELERLAARLGVSARVHYVGARRDVHAVMAAADAVVVPSLWDEPFGLVAAEAQLLGVPVVASGRGGLPELLDGDRLGLAFDPDHPGALPAAVARLSGEPGLRASLARAARGEARARYAYARWTGAVAEILRAAGAAPWREVSRAAPARPAHGPAYEATPPGSAWPEASSAAPNAK